MSRPQASSPLERWFARCCLVAITVAGCSDDTVAGWSTEEPPQTVEIEPAEEAPKLPSFEAPTLPQLPEPGESAPPRDDSLYTEPLCGGSTTSEFDPAVETWEVPPIDPWRDSIASTDDDSWGRLNEGMRRVFDRRTRHRCDGFPEQVYLEEGESLIMRTREGGIPDDFDGEFRPKRSRTIVATVDHKTVDSLVEHWAPGRTGSLYSERSSGHRYDVRTAPEIFDVTIPASAFTPGKSHDVLIFMSRSHEDRPSNQLRESYRFAVHYGGTTTQATRPCAAPSRGSESTPWERWANRGYDYFIYPVGYDRPVAANERVEPVKVDPGESIEFVALLAVGLVRNDRPEPHKEISYALLRDGVPVSPIYWQKLAVMRNRDFDFPSARARLTATLPTVPGIYEFQLMTTLNPYRYRENEYCESVNPATQNRESLSSSNVIRVEVVSPTERTP